MVEDDFSIERSDDEGVPVEGAGLTASGIAEYIRFNCCPRFFKLKLDSKDKNSRWKNQFKPVNPLLFTAGKALEEKKVAEIKTKAAHYMDFNIYDPHEHGWGATQDSMDNLRYVIEQQVCDSQGADDKPILLYQVPMMGQIGVWTVKGISDLIAVWPIKDGKVKVRIFELKSSWKEQTAHRIQVAIYYLLLTKQLQDLLSKVELEGGVINKETDLKALSPQCLPKFKLEPLVQDVERLLSEEGELNRLHQASLDQVEYQLCWRCDNCGYNECCIIDAIERESISLLNLSRGEQHALNHYNITALEDLAKLKPVLEQTDLRPYEFKAIPAKDKQKVQELSTDPVVGAKLDWFVQRAQFMLGGIRPGSPYASKTRYMPWLTGTGYGSLPEDSAVPGAETMLLSSPDGMIRVYLFVEWDYMLDVISLISARVDCTKLKGEAPSLSQVIGNLPESRQEC